MHHPLAGGDAAGMIVGLLTRSKRRILAPAANEGADQDRFRCKQRHLLLVQVQRGSATILEMTDEAGEVAAVVARVSKMLCEGAWRRGNLMTARVSL